MPGIFAGIPGHIAGACGARTVFERARTQVTFDAQLARLHANNATIGEQFDQQRPSIAPASTNGCSLCRGVSVW